MDPKQPRFEESREISIKLEHYDDIFSDFDMRELSKRALSVDFLEEIKRAANDKNKGGIELALHAPAGERDASVEATIKERLAAHFNRHLGLLHKEKRNVLSKGFGMVFLGVAFMIGATLVVFQGAEDDMLLSFLVVFLEPAAWFLLWEGSDQIIFNSKNINPELDFYEKMSDARGQVTFRSY